jgi:AraC-like DNA-binding protein
MMLRTIGKAPVAGMTLQDVRMYLSADGEPVEHAEALLAAHLGEAFDAEAVVPLGACWRIFAEHSARVGDETHRVFGGGLRPGGTTLLIARMLHAGTLVEAMRAYAESMAVMLPELSVTVTSTRNGAALRWRCEGLDSDVRLLALEATASAYYAIFSWLAGEPLPVVRVRAPARRKDARASPLRLMPAPIAHAGEDLEVVFDAARATAAISPRPLEGWQEGVYRMICSEMLRSADPASGFAERARSAVLEGVDQQALAERWGVSTKTVARRLEQEGSSFRRIRDEVRMEKSTSLIHAGLTVEEIAELLGYEDTRSFRRAFRRWFGVSPSAYRVRPLAA